MQQCIGFFVFMGGTNCETACFAIALTSNHPPTTKPHMTKQVAEHEIACILFGTLNRIDIAVPVTGMTTAVTAQQGNVLRILDTRLGCYGIMDINKKSPLHPTQIPSLTISRLREKFFVSNSVNKFKNVNGEKFGLCK